MGDAHTLWRLSNAGPTRFLCTIEGVSSRAETASSTSVLDWEDIETEWGVTIRVGDRPANTRRAETAGLSSNGWPWYESREGTTRMPTFKAGRCQIRMRQSLSCCCVGWLYRNPRYSSGLRMTAEHTSRRRGFPMAARRTSALGG
jgi:hypothetical protein